MRFILITVLFYNAGLLMAQEEVDVLDLSDMDLEKETIVLEDVKQENIDSEELKVEEIVEPKNDYRYASFGKDDPFAQPPIKNMMNTQKDQGPASSNSEIPMISPLQAFPLDQLAVKGVWVLQNGEARAVIMTPKKEGVIVKKEDPISAGKVLDIRKDRILVRQYQLREDGSRTFNDIEMPIGMDRQKKLGTIKLSPGKSPTFQRVEPKIPSPPKTENTMEKPMQDPSKNSSQGKPVPDARIDKRGRE